MSGSEPVGRDNQEAAHRRTSIEDEVRALIAGPNGAFVHDHLDDSWDLWGDLDTLARAIVATTCDAGRSDALVRVLAILEELRLHNPAGVGGEGWNEALDAVRSRVALLQASAEHDTPMAWHGTA